jgi:IS4 transposase
MMFGPLLERFTDNTPLTVMTRALLENALQPQALDDLFDRTAQRQYPRELLFSTVVQAMALVACRIYKSPHAVYVEHGDWFPVTLKCFYEKLQGVELPVMRELVRDNARRLQPVLEQLQGALPPLLPGYRVKILDGNALAGTQHRLKELRQTRAAALPGKSLVVLDPVLGLTIDVIPCEDGHTQERALLGDILETVQPKDLWIEDRNFCTLGFLLGVVTERRGSVLVREHKNLPWKALNDLCRIGRIDTGVVYEQDVQVEEGGRRLKLRRIVIRLDEPTRDGDTEVVLLTNVRRVSALRLARLYLKRWAIENVFNVLTTTLQCEESSLGYPKAALFAFCVTLVAYNVLATVKAALRGVHGAATVEDEVSLIKLTEHVCRNYEGMMAGMPAPEWLLFRDLPAKEMADWLRRLAAKVRLERVRKAPTRRQKRNKPKPKPPFDPDQPHVATARLLAARRRQA